MTLACEEMGTTRVKKIFANELRGEDISTANVRDLSVLGLDNIRIYPNLSEGNDPAGPLVTSTAKRVVVHGNLEVLGNIGASKFNDLSGSSALAPYTSEISVAGNLNYFGTLNCQNPYTNSLAVADKVVGVSRTPDSVVAYWPFVNNSGNDVVGSPTPFALSLTGATIVNTRLEIRAGAQFATASSALFPSGTNGFLISATITPVAMPTVNSTLMGYGIVTGNYLRVDLQTNGKLQVTDGTNTALFTPSGASTIAAGGLYNIALRRDARALRLFVNDVELTNPDQNPVGTAMATMAAKVIAPTPFFYLGHFQGSSTTSYNFDDAKIVKVTYPTNTSSSNSGILVEGDGVLDGQDVERSIKWFNNAAQDAGDYTGSYWHVQGGQLLLSRTIENAKRKAPGTDVLLSTLPLSNSDNYRWEFTTGLTGEIGGLAFAASATNPASVQVNSGVLKCTSGGSGTGAYFASVTSSLFAAATFTVSARIIPQSSLTDGAADGLELLSYGAATNTGSNMLVVYVTGGGKLAVTNNYSSSMRTDITTSVVLSGKTSFVLGLVVNAGTPQLYVDGIQRPLATAALFGLNISNPILSLGSKNLTTVRSKEIWYDDVRLSNSTLSADGQAYGLKSDYDGVPLTVTYGFRIADDESLQIVKVRGSSSATTIKGLPRPVNDNNANSMGVIGTDSVEVVSEMLNKP